LPAWPFGPVQAFSLWFRADGPITTAEPSAGGRILTSYRGGGDRVAHSVLVPGDGTNTVWFLYDEVNAVVFGRTVIADAGLQPALWHHVVYSFDGTDVLLAFDGAVQRVPRAGSSTTGAVDLGWASLGPRGPAHFTGWVDEVRFWRRPLAPVDVQALWSRP
jgi:hypothetical protein